MAAVMLHAQMDLAIRHKNLTAVAHSLFANVNRLEVGSESGEDRGKSIKTTLMSLFEGSGNTDVEVNS